MQIKLVKSLHLDEVVQRTLIGVIAPEMSNFAVFGSVSSKLAITIIKQRVIVSFIKSTSTPTGLIIPVINNDLFLTVIQARIQNFFKGGFQGCSKTGG
jgi:hypothetical protein